MLWLPILLCGVALFIASWAAWMLLPHHKADWNPLPNEEEFTQMLRGAGIAPGQYMFPHCPTPEERKGEAFQSRLQSGPNGILYVWRLGGGMGLNLVCTWLLFTVLSLIIGYLAGMVMPPMAFTDDRWFVFRFVGTAGILTYANAGLLNAIWFRRKIWGDIVDGLVYALITAAIFAAMWPAPSA